MNIILLHENQTEPKEQSSGSLLRFAVCDELLSELVFSCIDKTIRESGNGANTILVPQAWNVRPQNGKLTVKSYDSTQSLVLNTNGRFKKQSWLAIYNGRFIIRVHYPWLYGVLDRIQADVVGINVLPQLQDFYEKTLITAENHLVGFRRFYGDTARPGPILKDWPHCLFIRSDVLGTAAENNKLSVDFGQFTDHCAAHSLTVRSLEVAGVVLDLDTEKGLIGLLRTQWKSRMDCTKTASRQPNVKIDTTARLAGEIALGRDTQIDSDVLIAGPAVIGSHVRIGRGSVIRSSIIAPGVSIPPQSLIQNRIWLQTGPYGTPSQHGPIDYENGGFLNGLSRNPTHFRIWPRFSYAGFYKRIIDVILSLVVLILFTPVMLAVAVAIKLTSPGPVFFKHKRQGLHGKAFNCIKFRTMIVGADEMQEKIRRLNQVDGPQFRIEDDPRISLVGKFLRDTYLDEIPQFLNVLLGQMSLVGPRPSPESENTLCPFWRDARLSVRPGISGLWQIHRTRQPMQDFQEWIYYDIKYVKNLSAAMDLQICWMTAKKMFENFIRQF